MIFLFYFFKIHEMINFFKDKLVVYPLRHTTHGATRPTRGACFALKIEGGSLFAHRACGTTYAAHSLELKVKLKLSNA